MKVKNIENMNAIVNFAKKEESIEEFDVEINDFSDKFKLILIWKTNDM